MKPWLTLAPCLNCTCADHKKRLVRAQPGKPRQQVHLNKLTGIKNRKPHRFKCAFMSLHPQHISDYFAIHHHPVIYPWLKRRKWNCSCWWHSEVSTHPEALQCSDFTEKKDRVQQVTQTDSFASPINGWLLVWWHQNTPLFITLTRCLSRMMSGKVSGFFSCWGNKQFHK